MQRRNGRSGAAYWSGNMSAFKHSSTGSGAISSLVAVPAATTHQLLQVTLHLSAAPATSEDFRVSLKAAAGAVYDTVLFSQDLSVDSVTDLLWIPDRPVLLVGGDEVEASYPNTDAVEFGLQIAIGTEV
jgi:hypothetical protein